MSTQDKLALVGQRWSGCASIFSMFLAVVVALGGSTLFYNEVLQKKVLSYTILPSYELNAQTVSSLIVENRGRVPLTEIQIVLTGLSTVIDDVAMPGPHEDAQITNGGNGFNEVTIKMERLSRDRGLSIFISTPQPITINEGNLSITAKEVVGLANAEVEIRLWIQIAIPSLTFLLGIMLSVFFVRSIRPIFERRKEAENKRVAQKLFERVK